MAITERARDVGRVSDVQAFARVSDDIADFEKVSSSVAKADVIAAANKHDELTKLDGPTVAAATRANKADEAASVVSNSENGAGLLNRLDKGQKVQFFKLGGNTIETAVDARRTAEAVKLIDETGIAGRSVLDALKASDDANALNRFLSLENSLSRANGIESINKGSAELASDIRVTIIRSSTLDINGIEMSTETINRFTRTTDELARGNVDNFAKHVNDKIATQAENLHPENLASVSRPKNLYNPVKGAVNEVLIGGKIYGANNVDEIGASISKPSGSGEWEADLVLTNGRVVEAKSASVGSSTKIRVDLENIREYQKRASTGDTSQPVVFISNDPDEIYKNNIGGEYKTKIQTAMEKITFPSTKVKFKAASELTDDISDSTSLIPEFHT